MHRSIDPPTGKARSVELKARAPGRGHVSSYLAIKTVHILASTVLFGTGLGIAFFFFRARGETDPAARYFAARTTVLADFLFTLPAVILQPLTGFWLIAHSAFRWNEPWLLATYALYLIAGVCWVPVVFIQIRLRALLQAGHATSGAPGEDVLELFRWWFLLGWPAFIGLVLVFLLMVLKPTW
jgi:uncharacterized membrane protein